jgi:hypothetical protein
MYDERIEAFIKLALVDNVLTDKEREILIRKAVEAGIDQDEFEMVLDARLFERNTEEDSSEPELRNTEAVNSAVIDAAPTKPKADLSKCPACGGVLPAYAARCTDCNFEISERDSNASIQKLFEMLNQIESSRQDSVDSSNPFAALGNFYAKSFSSILGPGAIERKKMEVISSFPIPTTKADMLEFLALALPKAKQNGNFLTRNSAENKVHNEMVPVWKTKCEQIIIKARFSLKDDPKILQEINNYANQIEIN